MHVYKCKLVKIVDGDTVDIDIDLGFNVILKNERVRVVGIDTPESRTRNKVEKLFGLAAKHRVIELFKNSKTVHLLSNEFMGKFGRILGDFRFDNDRTLTEILLEEHHCVKYSGKSKSLVKAEHLKNRELLMESGIVSRELVKTTKAKMQKQMQKKHV